MIDIDKAFNPETKSVHAFYQSPGVGFYIPLYQREYSWDSDNIDQLIDDISRGLDNLAENPKEEIRFLGTIIAVKIVDKRKIYPIDPKGLPSTIENIIDGQQRLSTIALFSTILHQHIRLQERKIKPITEEEEFLALQLEEVCNYWKGQLEDIFSLDLKRGKPNRKPKIIRGNKDQWTKDGDIQSNYVSNVANHIANFIDSTLQEDVKPLKFDRSTRTGKNLGRIDRWFRNIVTKAHSNQSSEFITAWEIIAKVDQDSIWQQEREELSELILQKEADNKKSLGYVACTLVQLFAVCHYLLDRCCFTIIQPMNEDWAFDMFQSLNATGTPLTAIETFKPTVVNVTDSQSNDIQYKDSLAEKSFNSIDNLFADTYSASQKSKLANEFLTSFALTTNGYKLESHFSKQRRWLEDTYTGKKDLSCKNYQQQCDFIHFFGNYARFYKEVWLDYKGENNLPLSKISSHEDAEIASLIILYLKESSHKMAITVLGFFYNEVLDGKEDSISNFVEACKAIARFYTLWRSSDSNAGLDNVYRSYFRGEEGFIKANNWFSVPKINLEELKLFLNKKLAEKEIETKEQWLKKSKNYLSYNKSKYVSKFTLFVTAHETIPDTNEPGLMKKGMSGTTSYLTLKKWNSDDLKSIEHIAPRKPTENDLLLWHELLYGDDELFERIGNLTLLPLRVNISASNKGWIEKHLYFQHLSEKDQEKQQELANNAKSKGITLSKETIELLQKANFNDHISSIVALGSDKEWNSILVRKRTERILNLLWGYFEA